MRNYLIKAWDPKPHFKNIIGDSVLVEKGTVVCIKGKIDYSNPAFNSLRNVFNKILMVEVDVPQKSKYVWGIVLVILLSSCHSPAYATQINLKKVVDAIGKAENSKTHPYGIMVKYKHTTPRQACLNTVKHRYQHWVKSGSKGDFITYLGNKYAPIGVANDPKNLNRNWITNVRYYLGLRGYNAI